VIFRCKFTQFLQITQTTKVGLQKLEAAPQNFVTPPCVAELWGGYEKRYSRETVPNNLFAMD
jgi:hypothetical protein